MRTEKMERASGWTSENERRYLHVENQGRSAASGRKGKSGKETRTGFVINSSERRSPSNPPEKGGGMKCLEEAELSDNKMDVPNVDGGEGIQV